VNATKNQNRTYNAKQQAQGLSPAVCNGDVLCCALTWTCTVSEFAIACHRPFSNKGLDGTMVEEARRMVDFLEVSSA
jgi:hypothetical protein